MCLSKGLLFYMMFPPVEISADPLLVTGSSCPPAVFFKGQHPGEVRGNPSPREISRGGICARAAGGSDSYLLLMKPSKHQVLSLIKINEI